MKYSDKAYRQATQRRDKAREVLSKAHAGGKDTPAMWREFEESGEDWRNLHDQCYSR